MCNFKGFYIVVYIMIASFFTTGGELWASAATASGEFHPGFPPISLCHALFFASSQQLQERQKPKHLSSFHNILVPSRSD